MRSKQLAVLLFLLLTSPILTNMTSSAKGDSAQTSTSLYFGVDVAFEDLTTTLQIIDEVSSYTNLFIIGCYGPKTLNDNGHPVYNETRLDVISQYAYGKGLSFIVYSDDPGFPSREWLHNAQTSFGDKFLGIYYYDEPGGKRLDQAKYPAFYYAENFSDAANRYVRHDKLVVTQLDHLQLPRTLTTKHKSNCLLQTTACTGMTIRQAMTRSLRSTAGTAVG